jgi:hypothetical protein
MTRGYPAETKVDASEKLRCCVGHSSTSKRANGRQDEQSDARTDACSLSHTFVVFSASARSNQSTTEDIGQSRVGRCWDVR